MITVKTKLTVAALVSAALLTARPAAAQHVRIGVGVGIGYPGVGVGAWGHGPYYAFHPRVSVSFGFYAGYPVPYPYGYYGAPYYPYPYYGYYPAPAYGYGYYPAPYYARPYGPYPYRAPYARPYYRGPHPAPHGRISSSDYSPTPAAPAYGARTTAPANVQARPAPREIAGLSFNVTPPAAAVFVDNVYVGEAKTFSATQPPLNVSAGRHAVELRADGYQATSFQIDAVAGQVLPFQGTLRQH
jgi:hypothetical protein